MTVTILIILIIVTYALPLVVLVVALRNVLTSLQLLSDLEDRK